MNISKLKAINTEFTLFLVTRILVTAGIKMTPVLLGWYLYELTGSKLSLGVLGLSEVVPAILFALPAGVKVDSSDKRKLILTCLSVYLGIMVVFSWLTSSYSKEVFSSKNIEYLIYLLVVLTGWARAYYSPANSAIIAQLVKADELVKAATTNSMSWLIAAVAGPLIAGGIIAIFDVSAAFIFVASLIAVAMFIFSFVTPKEITYNRGDTKTWESVKEGLDFVFNHKPLLGAMGLDMFAVLFGGAVAMLPVFAKDILHVGPQGFGVLMAATYLGNFLAIFYLTRRPLVDRQGHYLIISVAGFGVCILIFALSQSFVLSFIALLVSGLFDGVSVIVRGTIFQLFVPNQMRGRVSSVNSIFINSSNELGQFESGVAASVFGTVPSVVFGGLMTILIATYANFMVPALKKLKY
ncbi:MAG TPA: MFS transporter [Saprospiraceae bacterium]|nr:MFS transporter [Saprospiraceae bacterium]